MSSSNNKFTARLESRMEGKGFQHPSQPDEFIPYIKRKTKNGHLIINTLYDDFGVLYPGRSIAEGGKGCSYTTAGTSGDQRQQNQVLSKLLARGIPQELFVGLFIANPSKIDWDDVSDFDYSSLPPAGSLIKGVPTPWYEEIITDPNNTALQKLNPIARGDLFVVHRWRYEYGGKLWLYTDVSRSDLGAKSQSGCVDMDPRKWSVEVVGGVGEERTTRTEPI